jgi:hypothetical protein
MYKRGDFFLLGVLLILLFSVGIVSARITGSVLDVEQEYPDAVLGEDAGIGPDNFLYFLDTFFDRFGDDLEVKEEKVAEIREMIQQGKFEDAREALRKYRKLADELEREIDPERRDEARRSAAAIKRALNVLASEMPDDLKEEFVYRVIEKEDAIITAAEIANRIKELCEVLSELDPLEYSRICKTGDDSPDWQKKLDKEWTEEQRDEAKKFGDIMSECFRTSGQQCNCESIPFTAFAEMCLIAAPLATACDVGGDEEACEKLDDLEMPELPPHLQEVFDKLEGDIKDDQYEMHMPHECVEAGVTSPEECRRIMITIHAPEECKEALLAADVESEEEGREICERVMMEIHAPECVEAGITDPDECQDYMFSIDRRPRECQEHQIHDIRDCERFLEQGGARTGPGSKIDFNCREIEDSMQRLECYDKAASQAEGFGGFDDSAYDGPCMTGGDWEVKKQECRNLYGEHAGDEPIMGDSGEGYECPVDIRCIDFGQYKEEDFGEKRGDPWEGCEALTCAPGYYCEYGECFPFEEEFNECSDGCEDECPDADRTDCVGGNRCECFYEEPEPEPTPEPEPGSETTPSETTESSNNS